MELLIPVILTTALALGFGFFAGIHDSSNIVSTIISSRAFPPRLALIMIAAAEIAGPFLLGVAVAKTIVSIAAPEIMTTQMVAAALSGALLWSLLTWYFAIPNSSSHALVGGLIGAVVAGAGFDHLNWDNLRLILIFLFVSPVIGLLVGYFFTKLIFFLARNASLKINLFFLRAQLFTAFGLGISHGANDGQKVMGMITLGLIAAGQMQDFSIPFWVILISALSLALGTSIGGYRLIKTVGARYYKIRPVHGFSSQISSALIVLTAGLLGGPVSTTQVINSSILGVGSAENLKMVRWIVARSIVIAWVLTIPLTAAITMGIYWIIHLASV